ncbi:MAG TPA: DUF2442 domain-containing protein [Candidatus Eisenbacteria bacterium]|jgi:hypothetical protein
MTARHGSATFQVEVSGISPLGIWLFVGDRELFLPFRDFPWFRDAPVAGVLHVERPQPHHLYWPDLDIDIAVDSILNPGQYPLVSRERPAKGRGAGSTRPRPATKRRRR